MKRKTAGMIAAALGLTMAVAYWWLDSATRPVQNATLDTRVIGSGASAPASGATPVTSPVQDTVAPAPENPSGETASTGEPASAATPTVGDILAEPDDNYVRVAKKLAAIALNPAVPMVEREEALAHTLNLSAGNEAEVLTPLVKDPKLPDALAETILSEALNRPLAYQADLYLEALATRKSPEMQANIREHLTFLVGGEDKGPNPADWVEAIKAAKASWPQ